MKCFVLLASLLLIVLAHGCSWGEKREVAPQPYQQNYHTWPYPYSPSPNPNPLNIYAPPATR